MAGNRLQYIWRMGLAIALIVGMTLQAALPVQAAPRFSALAVDARTGAVLYSQDAGGQRHPASLTKMMTLYVVFQELKAGRIKLSTPLRVSKRAAAMAPSKLGLKPGSTITVEEAIKALVVKSANDAAATVAENLGGSEAAFASRMTRVARSLGMTRTTFRNASGLPNPGQVTTANDMATLGLRLMRDFPRYYPYFRLTAFNFRGRTIRTHNGLLRSFRGTDGIKTGYISASGFNLVTSTLRDGRRVVGVVMGAKSASRRNAYMMAMLQRALPKAKPGNSIAAMVGSSKGAINPIAIAQAPAATTGLPPEPQAEGGNTAALQTPAGNTKAKDMGALAAAAEAAAKGNDSPQVVIAELDAEPENVASVDTGVPSNAKPEDPLKSLNLGKSYSVQISAFADKDTAVAAISKVKATAVAELKGKKAYTIAVRKNGKIEYRVVIAGLTAKTARQSCAKVSKIGKTCAVILPHA
jgi:D-alanyl-D-alanine carboxypeptidase